MSVLERVADVFGRAFAVDPTEVSPETVPDDVEKWDSMGHMNMVGELEKEFGIQFELDEIMELASVEIIIDTLKSKGVND